MPSLYIKFSPTAAAEEPGVFLLELTLPRVGAGVDMYEFDRLNEEIARLTANDRAGRWVMDLSDSHYIGSAILGLLVNLRQRIRGGGGHLALCGLDDQLAGAMRACSLYNLFSIAATRADAIRLVKTLR